jgi:glyoxylase-like metal-dependent hydrolase (beta-lactamase superfamily II)
MIFRQLFDPQSSTYTYLLADSASREAVLIDPVFEQVRRENEAAARSAAQAPASFGGPAAGE